MKILMVYPNLPLMFAPAISVGIFNAICKQHNVDFKVFETTEYSDQYKNRHILMTAAGANRKVAKDDRDYESFQIKDPKLILPDFIKTVEDYQPDLILIHFQEDVVQIGLDLLDSIKDKNIPHIAGGVYAISVPEQLLKEPLINVVCRYEGEQVLINAIQAFKDQKPLTSIDGVWWKDEQGKVHKNKPCPLTDITKTFADFSCYDMKRWHRPMGGRVFKRALSMETYRGCPYKCTFCNSPTTRDVAKTLDLGNFMRRKPIDVVEKELLWYLDQGYDPDLIMFIDDSFLARPAKEIFAFAEMWSKYKIPFWFNTRIENCQPEYLQALKEAGLYRITLGIESGNEKYRQKVLKRSVTNETYRKYLGYINDSDIPYSLNVIIAMPYETRQMVLETALMIQQARGYDGLTLSIWQPYRGTELRALAEKEGWIEKDQLTPGTGFLDFDHNCAVKMPNPYIQPDEATRLVKTFSLYAYYPQEMWPLIEKAETDEKLLNTLMERYRKEFFPGDYQIGGKSRLQHLQKYCAKHDHSSTYNFEII